MMAERVGCNSVLRSLHLSPDVMHMRHGCLHFKRKLRACVQYLIRMQLRPIDPTDLIAAKGGAGPRVALIAVEYCTSDAFLRHLSCRRTVRIFHLHACFDDADYGEELRKLPFVNGTEGMAAPTLVRENVLVRERSERLKPWAMHDNGCSGAAGVGKIEATGPGSGYKFNIGQRVVAANW